MPALALPHVCYGLSVRRMAVLSTFRRPSMRYPVHRQLMRNELLDMTPIIPATYCHQRNYVGTYSRYMRSQRFGERHRERLILGGVT
jgi:hypothetical protein